MDSYNNYNEFYFFVCVNYINEVNLWTLSEFYSTDTDYITKSKINACCNPTPQKIIIKNKTPIKNHKQQENKTKRPENEKNNK